MKLLILGATGLVGSHVLELALADSRIDAVVAPVRKPLAPHPKLKAPVVNFEQLPIEAGIWNVDAVICALGTTIKTAGSQEAFLRVDRDYPLLIAELAKSYGAPVFVLNSAMGANPQSKIFYNRVKGEVEEGLKQLNFKSLTLVRPGLIGGHRNAFRFGEEIAKAVARLLHPVLPVRWHLNPARQIAATMIKAALEAKPGIQVITSEELIHQS